MTGYPPTLALHTCDLLSPFSLNGYTHPVPSLPSPPFTPEIIMNVTLPPQTPLTPSPRLLSTSLHYSVPILATPPLNRHHPQNPADRPSMPLVVRQLELALEALVEADAASMAAQAMSGRPGSLLGKGGNEGVCVCGRERRRGTDAATSWAEGAHRGRARRMVCLGSHPTSNMSKEAIVVPNAADACFGPCFPFHALLTPNPLERGIDFPSTLPTHHHHNNHPNHAPFTTNSTTIEPPNPHPPALPPLHHHSPDQRRRPGGARPGPGRQRRRQQPPGGQPGRRAGGHGRRRHRHSQRRHHGEAAQQRPQPSQPPQPRQHWVRGARGGRHEGAAGGRRGAAGEGGSGGLCGMGAAGGCQGRRGWVIRGRSRQAGGRAWACGSQVTVSGLFGVPLR